MIHRVAADAVRVGRLDDDVAAQVGDLAAVVALAQVVVFERLVERELGCRRCAAMMRSSVVRFGLGRLP